MSKETEPSASDIEEPSFSVKVYVYDLSRGMAPMLSSMVLGTSIDAIYHTSVVVYGKEHYIDQGIKISSPGTTKYGLPIEVIDMGSTYITEDIFQEFLDELRNHESKKYHAASYDLFDNNCNHFSDVLLDFLVGKHLEDRILHLPQQVLNTPYGQMIRQMIGNNQIM